MCSRRVKLNSLCAGKSSVVSITSFAGNCRALGSQHPAKPQAQRPGTLTRCPTGEVSSSAVSAERHATVQPALRFLARIELAWHWVPQRIVNPSNPPSIFCFCAGAVFPELLPKGNVASGRYVLSMLVEFDALREYARGKALPKESPDRGR